MTSEIPEKVTVLVIARDSMIHVEPPCLDFSSPSVSLDESIAPEPMKITATGGQPTFYAFSHRRSRAAALREFRRLLGYKN